MRALAISAALAASVAAVSFAPAAQAKSKPSSKKAKGTMVTNVFRAEYDATVTWNQHSALPGMTEDAALKYTVRGRLPDLTFIDNVLLLHKAGKLETTVEGTVSLSTVKPEGTSVTCKGKTITVHGTAGVGRTKGGFWFAPWIAGKGLGHCTDTDGGVFDQNLTVGWPTEAQAAAEATPPGAHGFSTTFRQIDVDRWSKPFQITFKDDKCPNYDPAQTISCTFVAKGKLTLTRISREEEEDDSDLLAPVEPPKLNPKKTRATTTVECRSSCEIETAIGIFGGTKKHPRVIPIRRKTVRLKANRETTISMPVDAKGRAAATEGRLMMTLTVKGGSGRNDKQIHPLF